MEWSQWFVLSWIQFAVSSLLILVMSTIALQRIPQTVERARLIHASFLLLTALPFLSFITIVPTWRIDVKAWLVSSFSHNPALISNVPTDGQVNASRESLHASIIDRETTTFRSSESHTEPASHTEATSDLNAMTAMPDLPRSHVTDQEQTPTPARVNPWAVSFAGILGLQLVGCGWFMVVGLLGRIQLRRILRNSSIVSANVLERWSRVSQGRGSMVKILESESITTPMTFGCWAPIIVIPSSIGRQEGDDLDACLAHEWAHIQHKDAWIFTWANLLRIVYWYQPSVHMLCRELRVCQELIADRTAVRTVAEPIQYSELLMRLSAARPRPIPSGALTMVRPTSQLSRRIRALLEPDSITSTRCGFRFNVCIGLVLLAMLLSVSVIRINQVEATEPTVEQTGAVPKGLRSMTYVRKVVPRDNTKSTITYRETAVDDGRYRSESLVSDPSNAVISISNGTEIITLFKTIKRYSKSGFRQESFTPQHIAYLKNARTKESELLDAKEIDGKRAIGFSVQQLQKHYKVWNDETTGELVQIEFDDFLGNHVTMSQFQFDSIVDDSLFLCERPTGFRSLENGSLAGAVVYAMAALLPKEPLGKPRGASMVWERASRSSGIASANGDWFWGLGYDFIDAIDANNVRLFRFIGQGDRLSCVDIDGDGTNEILSVSNNMSLSYSQSASNELSVRSRMQDKSPCRLSIFSQTGGLIRMFEENELSKFSRYDTLRTIDLDGDARNEFIFGTLGRGASTISPRTIAFDIDGSVVRPKLLHQGIVDISPLKTGHNSEEYVVVTKTGILQIMSRSGEESREIAPGFKAYSVRTYKVPANEKENILAFGFQPRSKPKKETTEQRSLMGSNGALELVSFDCEGKVHWSATLVGPPIDFSFCPSKKWVAVVQNEVVQVVDLPTGKEIASVPGPNFRASSAAWVKGADGVPLLILKSHPFEQQMLTAYRIDE